MMAKSFALKRKVLGLPGKQLDSRVNFRIEEETPEMSSTGLHDDQAVSSPTHTNFLGISPTRPGNPIHVY